MTEHDDGFTVTNRDVYNILIEFKKEFGEYVKEHGPKIAVLEYEVKELKEELRKTEDRSFVAKQNFKIMLWAFGGSSVMLEILNYVLFHK